MAGRGPDRRSLRGVATFSSVTRQHILQAIAEYDTRGGAEFLELYGFEPSADYPLVHDGLGYDSKAILGVAHRYATGRLATSEAFRDGMEGAVMILRKRGFEVTEPEGAPRAPQAPRTRATRTPRTPAARTSATRTPSARSAAARETPPAICPTCSMALPATGICDDCS